MFENRPGEAARRGVHRWRNLEPATIVVADDHVIVRRGLRGLLEQEPGWSVVGEAGDGREAIEKAKNLQPHLMILDITMPELNGLDAIPRILKVAPSTRILVLSMHDEEELIHRSLRAGAGGYVLKSDTAASLLTAAEAVLAGRRFVSPSVTPVVLHRLPAASQKKDPTPEFSSLTKREQEVIQLLAEGKSNKQVATILSISVRTAENHRARLMKKLGVDSLSGLVRYAVRNSIIKP
jgi:DNA-binding NarL/FixJ family response regulator